MTVSELHAKLSDLLAKGHADCDVLVETNESDRALASLVPNVTPVEGDGFPVVLVRLEWDVPGTGGGIEWRDQQ